MLNQLGILWIPQQGNSCLFNHSLDTIQEQVLLAALYNQLIVAIYRAGNLPICGHRMKVAAIVTFDFLLYIVSMCATTQLSATFRFNLLVIGGTRQLALITLQVSFVLIAIPFGTCANFTIQHLLTQYIAAAGRPRIIKKMKYFGIALPTLCFQDRRPGMFLSDQSMSSDRRS